MSLSSSKIRRVVPLKVRSYVTSIGVGIVGRFDNEPVSTLSPQWDAQEARRLGLLQEIAPAGKHVERAMVLARRIAAMAPLGVRATIASANSALAVNEQIAFDELAAIRTRLSRSADAREAERAAAERRAPVFQGQ
jgi:enoyl-CoA hydratase/carnithine racemase